MLHSHTNRKNTIATKMRVAVTSNGGKVLIGAADIGRLFQSTGTQTETKAN